MRSFLAGLLVHTVVVSFLITDICSFMSNRWDREAVLWGAGYLVLLSFMAQILAIQYAKTFPMDEPLPPPDDISLADFREALVSELGELAPCPLNAEGAIPRFRRYRVTAIVQRDHAPSRPPGRATWWFDRLPKAIKFYFQLRRDDEYHDVELDLETQDGVFVIPIHNG